MNKLLSNINTFSCIIEDKNFRIMERKRIREIRLIFKVAFLLFLDSAGQSLTFT